MMKTYKEVQAVAKGLGIKANQKREVLERAIAMFYTPEATNEMTDEVVGEMFAAVVDERKAYNDEFDQFIADTQLQYVITESDIDKMFSTVEEERSYDSASEASANDFDRITQHYADELAADDDEFFIEDANGVSVPFTPIVPLFEFVRADNCIVVFKQKGIQVTVGWSKKDYKCYMHKVGSAPKLMMVQTAINLFKKYINGRDGDVAQIVKAFTRIRRKPSVITAMESKVMVVASTPSKRNAYEVIDAEWLKLYRQQQGENFDGRNVREDYRIDMLALESRGELG